MDKNITKHKKCQKITEKQDVFICLEIFKKANKIYSLPEKYCLVKNSFCEKCTSEKKVVFANRLIDKYKVDSGLLLPEDSKAHIFVHQERKREYDVSMFSEFQKLENVKINLPKIYSLTISCIIHSFNEGKKIDQIYNGLKNLDINEIVVCEDGSSDSSKEKWEKYSQKDNRIKIIYSNDIHELRCFDNAIRNSSSDICCLLQGDDIIPTDEGKWFKQGKELLEAIRDLVVLSGYSSINIHKIVSNKRFIREDHLATNIPDVIDLTINDIPFAYIMGATVGPYFVRKNSYIDLGGFEIIHKIGKPSIFHDMLFSLKVWDNNYKVGMYSANVDKPCGSCERKKKNRKYALDFNYGVSVDLNYLFLTYSNEKLEKIKNMVISSNLFLKQENKFSVALYKDIQTRYNRKKISLFGYVTELSKYKKEKELQQEILFIAKKGKETKRKLIKVAKQFNLDKK